MSAGATLPKVLGANVNLSNVDFKERDLSNHDLSGANLSGANLSGANLTGNFTLLFLSYACMAFGVSLPAARDHQTLTHSCPNTPTSTIT